MPVVTRSCGRKAPRRRIEDPTPRACRTTTKRRKDVSDEENEKPPRKKPNIEKKEEAPKTGRKNKNEMMKKSRIPRICLTEKKPTRSQITNNKDDDDDDDEIQFKTTVEESAAISPQVTNIQYTIQGTPPFISPVASRTRSYSALKRSYTRKKQDKANAMEESSTSSSEESDLEENDEDNSSQEGEKEDDAPNQVKEINSSTCYNDEDANSNDKEKNNHYYEKKFHEVVHTLKKMQEEFSKAHQNTRDNIAAYDAFIKELKTSLEQEKRKSATIEEELKETREQLLTTQKEIESAKTNEQQNNRSISSISVSKGPSQSEESSHSGEQEVELEMAETSTLLAMIKFYAGLTGITLSTDIPPSNSELIESFRCAYRPRSTAQAMQFRLTHDKEFEEYEYSPSFQTPKRGEFLHKLPKHFKENIYFSTDQAQSFLSTLLKAVEKL